MKRSVYDTLRQNFGSFDLVERDPDYDAASKAMESKDFQAMLRYAQRLKDRYLCHHKPYLIEGYALAHLNRPCEAIPALTTARKYSYFCDQVWRGLAVAKGMMGLWREAVTDIGVSVLLDPYNAASWRYLRIIYENAGLTDNLAGVDIAIANLKKDVDFKIPAKSLYGANHLVWLMFGRPGFPERDFAGDFEDPLDGAAPTLIAARRTISGDVIAVQNTPDMDSPDQVFGIIERFREAELWHPVAPLSHLTASQKNAGMITVRALIALFGLSGSEDPVAEHVVLRKCRPLKPLFYGAILCGRFENVVY
jgi:hypothetical protein